MSTANPLSPSTLTDIRRVFRQTAETLKAQWDKPFLKRYLQREHDLRRIGGCNQALTDAVSMFSVSARLY
jgi:abelson tyrosine-protein kinase 1